jgi:hypothetical protein
MINKVNIQKDIAKITGSILKAVTGILNNANVNTTKAEAVSKFKVEVNGNELDVVIPGYYLFVDKGRKKGKRPPVNAILNWIKREKIKVPQGVNLLSFAYAVANSIGKEGIKPRPFIEEVQDETAIITRDYMANIINKELIK